MTAFLSDLDLERDISRATREAYARDLTLLGTFLAARGIAGAGDAATEDLVAFLADRERHGESRRTRARRASAVRSFYRFLSVEGFIDRNPALLVPPTRPSRPLPKALDLADTGDLLAGGLDLGTPLGLRDRALLEVLYGGGLRASEAAGLEVHDVQPERALVRVVGKGRKERVVPLGQPALDAIAAWLERGRPMLRRPDSPDRLFLTRRGRGVARQTVYAVVRRCALAAGLKTHASPHTLRHSFATHLVTGGADLRAVQEMLGHASINTTQIYTALVQDHLRAAHRKHHPRG